MALLDQDPQTNGNADPSVRKERRLRAVPKIGSLAVSGASEPKHNKLSPYDPVNREPANPYLLALGQQTVDKAYGELGHMGEASNVSDLPSSAELSEGELIVGAAYGDMTEMGGN